MKIWKNQRNYYIFIHTFIEFINMCIDIGNQCDLIHIYVSLYNFPFYFVHAGYTVYVSFENRNGKFAIQYNLLKRPRRNLLWSTLDFHRFLRKPDRDRGDEDEEGLR